MLDSKNKAKKILKKLVLIVAKNIFWDCFFIVLVVLFIGWISYYKYSIMINAVEKEFINKPFFLDQADYGAVVKFWRRDENRIKNIDAMKYRDLFNPEKYVEPNNKN